MVNKLSQLSGLTTKQAEDRVKTQELSESYTKEAYFKM